MSNKAIVDLIDESIPQLAIHSRKTQRPVPASVLLRCKPVVEYLIVNEPGPKVDWSNFQHNLSVLKPFLLQSASGPGLLLFFKGLIETRAKYLIAYASHEAALMNLHHCSNYFGECMEKWRLALEVDDPDSGWKGVTGGGMIHRHRWLQAWQDELQDESKLTWANYLETFVGQEVFTKEEEFLSHIADHKSIQQQHAEFVKFKEQGEQFESGGAKAKLQQEIDFFGNHKQLFADKLLAIKTSDPMWLNSGRLWQCCKGYEAHLLKQRAAAEAARKKPGQVQQEKQRLSKKGKLTVSDRGSPLWTKAQNNTASPTDEHGARQTSPSQGPHRVGPQTTIDPRLLMK